MNKTTSAAFAFAAFALATTALPSMAQVSQVELPMDKRDLSRTLGRDEATKEWLKSWHKGEVYATQTEYLFDGMLEVEKNEDITGGRFTKWLKRWFADVATKNTRTIESGSFSGKSIAKTFVFHEAPRLRLIRDYQYVMGDGAWGGHVVPKSQVVKQAIGAAVEKDVFGRENRHAFYTAVGFADPDAGAFLSTWGEAGWEVSREWMRENVGTFDTEGRLNIGENSLIGKAIGEKEREEMMAMAMAFSDNVNGRKIAIATDGKYSHRIAEVKSVKSATADPRASVESFDMYLDQGTDANDDMKALVKRESFSVTSDLFDSEVRKPGDIWVVDGTFFNSFLHPDLKGAFRGRAVVKYIGDEEGDDAYISAPSKIAGKPTLYNVRKIEVLPNGKVDGSIVSTDLVYDERPIGGRFWAKYDRSSSSIAILIDKASGHMVYGKMDLNADDVGALPSLSLLDGFKSAGRGSLQLTFTGEVVPVGLANTGK